MKKNKQATNTSSPSTDTTHVLFPERLREGVCRIALSSGACEYLSPTMENVFGYPLEEWNEDNAFLTKIIHPDFAKQLEEQNNALLNGQIESEYQYKIIDNEGEERWIRQSNYPLYDKKKKIIGIEQIYVNITDLRKVQLAAQAIQAKYVEIYNHLLSGIAIYRYDEKVKDFYIVDINDLGAKMTHVKPEDVVGKRVTEAFPGVKEMGLFAVLQQVWKSGREKELAMKSYKDNKIETYFTNYVFKISSGEVVALYMDVKQEMQEQEEMRDRLEKNERMNRLMINREKKMIELKERIRVLEEQLENMKGK